MTDTNTNENLPAVLSESAQRFLDTPIDTGGQSFPFKVLNIIQEMGATTPEGLEIPVGSFAIKDTEIFGREVIFRPVAMVSKIMRRAGQEDNYKVTAETIYFRSWFDEERIDTLGGVDCGRIFGKAAKELTPEQQEINDKRGKMYTHVFGIATIGDNVPTLVMLSLTNGAPSSKGRRLQDAFNVKTIKGDYRTRQFKLSLVLPTKDPLLSAAEKKQAQNKHFNLLVDPDMTQVFSLRSIAEEGGQVLDYINKINVGVLNKHKEAVAKRNEVGTMVDVNQGYDTVNGLADDGIIEGEFETINDLN